MENASKALIIAASVLITIMLIAFGVTIFNNATSNDATSNLDTAEISMFNQKFERYADEKMGSEVKSLISFAISNASENKDEPSKLPTVILNNENNENNEIIIAEESNIDKLGNIRKNIVSTHTYTVNLEYGSSGLVNKITIQY